MDPNAPPFVPAQAIAAAAINFQQQIAAVAQPQAAFNNLNAHHIPQALLKYLKTKNTDVAAYFGPTSPPTLIRGQMVLSDLLSGADIGLNVLPEELITVTFNTPYRRLLKFTRGKNARFIEKRLGNRLIKYRLLFCHALAVLNGCKSLFFLAGYTYRFPPSLAEHKSETILDIFRRLTGGTQAFYALRTLYLRFQVETGLAQQGIPPVAVFVFQPNQQQQQHQQQQQ